MSRTRSLIVLLLALSLLAGACQRGTPIVAPQPDITQGSTKAAPTDAAPAETDTSQPAPSEQATGPIPQVDLVFARFQERPAQAVASLQQPQIDPDLSNVYNPFVLSGEQLVRLAQDGFVVTPGAEKEFFTVYEKARYENVPIFITSDSLLHSYHLLFDKVLRTAERQRFIPLLRELNASLLASLDVQYQELKDTPWEEASRRTVAFVAVASRLLDQSVQIPAYASELAEADLAQIEAAAGMLPSAIFPFYDYGEDFTQYIPRGHYTLSDDLKAYFKSMMWYGRMTFRLKPLNQEAGRAETRSALLLVKALMTSQVNGKPAVEAWADLYSPTVFFVGRSDDLTVLQYAGVIEQVYGPGAGLRVIADDSKLDAFIEQADQLPPPKILGMVIDVTQDEAATTKGMRFMGQRFVPDAYIFRQLIYRNVSTGEHRRGLPNGLDLPAAMGSARAYQILDEMGETSYEKYPEQMEKMRSWLSGLSVDEWTETLYNSWIYSFYPLLEAPGQGYPAFMQAPAWGDKQLNTVLGSWAELKHDTILYAKQVYAELGGGPPAPEPVPPKGYVEPVPAFYARLAALTSMTREGLQSRGLLSEGDLASLQRLEELSLGLQSMAEKELRGEALSEEEYHTIRFYGGELEHFVHAAADSDEQDPFAQRYMEEEPQAAVIADVATDPDPDNDGVPNPVVLEVAVGRINEIHAVVPVVQEDGSITLQIAKGGVFSYYEFQWPAEDRLTDEKWRAMLDTGEAPALPAWSASFFIPQGAYSELRAGVQQFEKDLTNYFWMPAHTVDNADFFMETPSMQILSEFLPELQKLAQEGQYMGRQLISAHFASFDIQSEEQAVVTVRETWQDTLYPGEYPDFGVPALAERGPYTRVATYTLRYAQDDYGSRWYVTKLQYDGQAPEWEEQ
jgi:hypothetical protein